MKLKNHKINSNKNNIFLLRFVTSYSILLIFVLIMGLFLYQYGINDAKNNLHNQNKSMLDNAANDLDNSLTTMNTLVTQISNDNSFRSLVKFNKTTEDGFQSTALAAMRLLTDFIPIETNLPISEYYVYLPKVGYVISNSMLSECKLFYKHYKAFDLALYDEWLDMILSKDNLKEFIEMKKYYKGVYDSFLYKVPMSTSYLTGNINAMVCFEINKTSLKDKFSNLDLLKTGFLLVKDNDGNEVFRITSTDTKESTIDHLLQTVKEQPDSMNFDYKEMELDHESVIVTTTTSSNGNWTYYLVQPSSLVFNDLSAYQNAYSIIIILTCLFCLLMIYILSKRNIKPIIKISDELKDTIEETHTLQRELEEQRPIIYSSYMGRIMKGLISTEQEANDIQKFLGLDNDQYKYSVLYASIYENQIEFYVEENNGLMETEEKPSDYRDIIRSYLHDYFGDNILIYEVQMNSFAVLLPTNASDTLEEANQIISNKFIELHNNLMDNHSIWIFGGLGNRNYHIPYLWKSYQQAIQAVSYIHEGSVFQAFKDIKRDKSSYYYPFEMAQQLSNFINTGNTRQVQEIFKLIRKENFEDVSLPMTLIKWLLSDIRNTLLKVRFSITATNENHDVLESVDASFQENKTIDLMEEISIKLCSLNEQKVEGNKLILSIKTYIKENYADSSLSLKKISEVFDISESYFSYLFKAETKQNFSEYLELIRMDQAMILLKTTDINVSEMYLELGYNNANSFRRAFKKIHGVSPKAIRDALLTKDA